MSSVQYYLKGALASITTERQESLLVIQEEPDNILLEYDSLFYLFLNIKVRAEYYLDLITALIAEWSTVLEIGELITLQDFCVIA